MNGANEIYTGGGILIMVIRCLQELVDFTDQENMSAEQEFGRCGQDRPQGSLQCAGPVERENREEGVDFGTSPYSIIN